LICNSRFSLNFLLLISQSSSCTLHCLRFAPCLVVFWHLILSSSGTSLSLHLDLRWVIFSLMA
jgi:hypothetical protein